MSTLIVDWLGRGGIAQTSEAWAIELADHGHEVVVATRAHRELATLDADVHCTMISASGHTRVAAHRKVVAAAARGIRDHRPSCVVIQNYVIPALELPVYCAARDVGAQLVLVVHDDRLHTRRAGSQVGFPAAVARADTIVAHTHWVAQRVAARTGRDVRVVAHPVQLGLLRRPAASLTASREDRSRDLVAVHFGVLRRRYKGTRIVEALAGRTEGWSFVALGVGAPPARPGLASDPRYLDGPDLVRRVGAGDAALLPYRHATQSGAVVLAQALGTVPLVSSVGGIPEQVNHGEDGILMTPGAGVGAWSAALADLRDDRLRKQLGRAACDRVWRAHDRFVAAIRELVA